VLEIDSGRPIARALLTLQARFGTVITYEDPRYVDEDDLVDVAPFVAKDYDKSIPARSRRMLVPKAAKLTLELPASNRITSTDLGGLLGQLVVLQNANNGGHFRVEQDGDVYHVIASEARDRNGKWKAQTPVLDTRVSLPEQEGTEREVFGTIAAAVSSAAQVQLSVTWGNGWVIGFPQTQTFKFSAVIDESARSVLARALKLSDKKRTWALLHAPELGSATFFLNILDLPSAPGSDVKTP